MAAVGTRLEPGGRAAEGTRRGTGLEEGAEEAGHAEVAALLRNRRRVEGTPG